jgi:hypothetical protein
MWLFMSLKQQPSLKNRMAGNRNMTPEMQKKGRRNEGYV